MEPVTIIGYAGTVVGTFLMLPQVYRSWRTKKVADVSWMMICMYFLNCGLWLAYGLLLSLTPIIITNGVALLISGLQIILKIRYAQKSGL